MGFWKRKQTVAPVASPTPPGGRTRLVIAAGGLDFEVVGTNHHEPALKEAAGRRPAEEDWVERKLTCQLLREPHNQFDSNAVAVWAGKHGHVGYIGREAAADLAPALDQALNQAGQPVDLECTGTIETNWDEDAAGKFVWNDSTITLHLDERMGATFKPPKG